MNKIFNNLRAILTIHKESLPVVTVAEMLAEIDEEEARVAKFEKDCCVWKWRIEDGRKVFKNCLYIADTHIAYSFKYCPYCGKPRKERAD